MTALQREVHAFVERLQETVGLAQLDARSTTAQRLLMLELAIPRTAVQPYALLVRGLLAMHVLRLATLAGPGVVGRVAELAIGMHATDHLGLREAYRSAVLPIVEALQGEAAGSIACRCTDPRVNAALGEIRRCATLPEGLRVGEIARACHVSKWHLERLLKRHTGLTFKQHVRTVRMAAARHLLGSSGLTMKEIAAQTGYLYGTEFGRDFKSHFGVTPTAWRRAALGETIRWAATKKRA
jgi:AraC-like DNA-binding protein